jgi:hypothetical protein
MSVFESLRFLLSSNDQSPLFKTSRERKAQALLTRLDEDHLLPTHSRGNWIVAISGKNAHATFKPLNSSGDWYVETSRRNPVHDVHVTVKPNSVSYERTYEKADGTWHTAPGPYSPSMAMTSFRPITISQKVKGTQFTPEENRVVRVLRRYMDSTHDARKTPKRPSYVTGSPIGSAAAVGLQVSGGPRIPYRRSNYASGSLRQELEP